MTDFEDDPEIQRWLEDLVQTDRDHERPVDIKNNNPLLFPHLYPPQHYRRRNTRRLSKNPNFMPELRILRRDIRRRYAEMFVNVINNHDLPLLIKFVQEFCRPDCRYIKESSVEENEIQALREAMNRDMITDLNGMIELFAFCFVLMPDSVFTLKESQVRVKQGKRETHIFAKISFAATRLYTFEIIDDACEDPRKSKVIAGDSSDSSDDSWSVGSNSRGDYGCPAYEFSSSPSISYDATAHSYVPVIDPTSYKERFRWTKIPVAMETKMESILSFTLDEMNKIRNLRLTSERFSERPAGSVHE